MTKTPTITTAKHSNNTDKLSLEHYHLLQYSVIITADDNGGYVATIPDLEGCVAEGETFEEAAREIEEVRKIWLEEACLADAEIPLPRKFSGTISLRMPPALHQEVYLEAKRREVSLNTHLVALITENNAYSKIASKLEQLSRNENNFNTRENVENSLEALEKGVGSLKEKEIREYDKKNSKNSKD